MPLSALLTDTLCYCFRFLARNVLTLLLRVALPVMAGCAFLYVAFHQYFANLLLFLAHPTGGGASRALGIAAAAFLILLLLHSIVVALIADIAIDPAAPIWPLRRIGILAWRLYATSLRLALALGVVAFLLLYAAAYAVDAVPQARMYLQAGVAVMLFWLLIRVWFFIAPVCALNSEDGTLSVTWRRSSGHAGAIAIVMAAIIVAVGAFQFGGEMLLRQAGVIVAPMAAVSLTTTLRFYQQNLWPVVVLASLTYMFANLLLTPARIRLYQRLIGSN